MNFSEFVNSKDREEVINHSGWETCSVGTYAKEHTGHFEELMQCGLSLLMVASKFLDGDIPLAYCLNHSGHYIKLDRECSSFPFDTDERVINTYGDLQDYLSGKLEITTDRAALVKAAEASDGAHCLTALKVQE